MSNTHSWGLRGSWLGAIALIFGLALTNSVQPARAEEDEDESRADKVQRLTEIANQKTIDEVAKALTDADRLGTKDPKRAAAQLKRTLTRVQNDENLTKPQRTALVRKLKLKLNHWHGAAERKAKTTAAQEDYKEKSKFQRSEDVRGRKSTSDQANETIRSINENRKEGKRIRRDKEKGFQAIGRDIDKSSVASARTVTFDPKVWARAKKRTSVKITKKEAAIIKILNSVMSVDFKSTKFEDVIEYLQDKTGQTILVDKEALKEKDIDYETPVTLKVKKVTVRTLLRKILEDVGLTYVIKDEVIQVTTLEKARKLMVTRSYPIGDLVTQGIDARLPPGLQRQIITDNAVSLILLIKQTIEPDSWAGEEKEGGTGGGTISFYFPTLSIVVRQSAEIHYKLGTFGR